ncbi:MAG TPA: HAMP domain-containing protein [Candidatus Fimicola cottocaccae]|nr:HAMP domain-containing protein [Candidatus Fimicola cottocaccae]
MKKFLSIKARVTMWYTFSMLIITSLVVVFLISFSQQFSKKQLQEKVIDIVTDTVQNVNFHNGVIDTDMDFYNNGVSLFIYDIDGYLIAPRVNKGIQVDSLLEDQTVKIVDSIGEKWLVYDLFAAKENTNFWVRGIVSMSGTRQTLSYMSFAALAILPVFVFIIAFGGFKITKKAFEPIKNIAETADTINSGNDLSSRIKIENMNSKDELSHLVRTMNDMLSRLQQSFETEKQFTSDVSHELRTPIAVMISQCEYALSGKASNDEKEEAWEAVLKNSKRMSDMVSQLLMFVRAENGKFKPHMEKTDITSLCEMIILDMEVMAEKAGIKCESDIKKDVYAVCDEVLIARLITNLISNGIRYNKPSGSVKLSLDCDDDFVIINVSDTGIGIKKENLEDIWNRFYRVDTSRSGEGTGLGLSMVKWIAQIHGGNVSVDSVFGIGSQFTVKIPIDIKN